MKKNHDEACYRLDEMVNRMFDQLSALANNYQYIERAMEHSSEQIMYERVEEYREMANDPSYDRDFSESRQELANGTYRTRVSGIIANDLKSALRRTAAASLVFAHSVFESCVYDLLRMTVEAGPEDWLPQIRNKQVIVADLAIHDVDEILFQLVEERYRSLERRSVLEKIDTLFAVVAPPPNRKRFTQYIYDRARIEQIDQSRHAVVHKDPLSYDPTKLKVDIEYLRVSVLWLGVPVLDKYNLHSKRRPLAP
jgi:hypothetical protein